ncbi:MAG: FAD:protein FMN transferase [Acidobacteriota bacterium]
MRRLFSISAMMIACLPAHAEPVRLAADAFGVQAEVEIRDLPRDEAVAMAREALREIFDIGQLLDPDGTLAGGLGALNAATEPIELEPRVSDLLRRGLQFCLWTNGAHGPLGGEIYRLWRETPGKTPNPNDLRDAVIGAQCGAITLTFGESVVHGQRVVDNRAEALAMGRGFALDRAADLLSAAGVSNAMLELGGVWRGMGDGPDGQGWLVELPPAPGKRQPTDRIFLRDQALAIFSIQPIKREPVIRLIDQRNGVPATGVVMVATVTEQALDAEALSASLFVTGLREGQMRLGGLEPRPSVLWLLGQGKGEPLESTYHWSELERMPRRRY